MLEKGESKKDKLIGFLKWANESKVLSLFIFALFVVWYWYLMTDIILWHDEVQPLLMVRANPSLLSLFNALRYEGTPGL